MDNPYLDPEIRAALAAYAAAKAECERVVAAAQAACDHPDLYLRRTDGFGAGARLLCLKCGAHGQNGDEGYHDPIDAPRIHRDALNAAAVGPFRNMFPVEIREARRRARPAS